MKSSWLRKAATIATFYRLLHEEKRMLRLDRERLHRLRERRFVAMVAYAYNHVPWYRQQFDAGGVRPTDIRSLADIGKLPVFTKDDLRRGFPRLCLSDEVALDRCLIFSSSGSAGEPSRIAWTRESAIRFLSITTPQFAGPLFDRELRSVTAVVTMGSGDTLPPISLDEPDKRPEGGILRRGNITLVDAFLPPEKIIEVLNERRAESVVSYPGILAMVAEYALSHGIPLYSPKVVVLTAEQASAPVRELLQRAFAAPLRMFYASTEAGALAASEPVGDKFRIFSWDVIVELLDDHQRPVGSGETGNVVVTTLCHKAVPLIRYAGLGDLAVSSEGGDGSAFTLDSLQGRRVEILHRPDGTNINPYVVHDILSFVDGIVQYQLVQHSLHEIEILFVVDRLTVPSNEAPLSSTRWSNARKQLQELFGPASNIRLTPVETIPRARGRFKTPLIINKTRQQTQAAVG